MFARRLGVRAPLRAAADATPCIAPPPPPPRARRQPASPVVLRSRVLRRLRLGAVLSVSRCISRRRSPSATPRTPRRSPPPRRRTPLVSSDLDANSAAAAPPWSPRSSSAARLPRRAARLSSSANPPPAASSSRRARAPVTQPTPSSFACLASASAFAARASRRGAPLEQRAVSVSRPLGVLLPQALRRRRALLVESPRRALRRTPAASRVRRARPSPRAGAPPRPRSASAGVLPSREPPSARAACRVKPRGLGAPRPPRDLAFGSRRGTPTRPPQPPGRDVRATDAPRFGEPLMLAGSTVRALVRRERREARRSATPPAATPRRAAWSGARACRGARRGQPPGGRSPGSRAPHRPRGSPPAYPVSRRLLRKARFTAVPGVCGCAPPTRGVGRGGRRLRGGARSSRPRRTPSVAGPRGARRRAGGGRSPQELAPASASSSRAPSSSLRLRAASTPSLAARRRASAARPSRANAVDADAALFRAHPARGCGSSVRSLVDGVEDGDERRLAVAAALALIVDGLDGVVAGAAPRPPPLSLVVVLEAADVARGAASPCRPRSPPRLNHRRACARERVGAGEVEQSDGGTGPRCRRSMILDRINARFVDARALAGSLDHRHDVVLQGVPFGRDGVEALLVGRLLAPQGPRSDARHGDLAVQPRAAGDGQRGSGRQKMGTAPARSCRREETPGLPLARRE